MKIIYIFFILLSISSFSQIFVEEETVMVISDSTLYVNKTLVKSNQKEKKNPIYVHKGTVIYGKNTSSEIVYIKPSKNKKDLHVVRSKKIVVDKVKTTKTKKNALDKAKETVLQDKRNYSLTLGRISTKNAAIISSNYSQNSKHQYKTYLGARNISTLILPFLNIISIQYLYLSELYTNYSIVYSSLRAPPYTIN